jgi:outer membrane receptor protein involved in Fe transport
MTIRSGVRRALIGCALGSVAAGNLHAQDQADTDSRRSLEEIIVTAQKREQNVQDVPIVVTTISSELIRDTGIQDIKDLTLLTPGMIVTSTSNETSTTARIRGVGTVGDNVGLESSVGVVIDEVYRPRNGVGFGDLGELERIEVLKGPQGTLFGKNTSAGVINITTKKPEFDFGAQAEATGGNEGIIEYSLSLTGPLLGDTLAGRIYYGHREHDGYLDIATGGGPRSVDEDNDRDIDVVRGQLLWEPGDEVSVRFIADWAERSENCCIGVQLVSGATAPIINALAPGGIALPADAFARDGYANRGTPQDVEDKGVSLQVDWDMEGLGGARFTSVTSYRDWQSEVGQDSDFTAAGLLFREPASFGNKFESATQEFRLAGESDRVSWLVGAFYADEDLESKNSLRYDSQLEPYLGLLLSSGTNPAFLQTLLGRPLGTSYVTGQGSDDVFDQSSKSWALFTNNTFRITERFEATLGLRYTDEEKKLGSSYDNTDGGIGCGTARQRVPLLQVALPGFGLTPAQVAGIIGGLGALGCAPFADPLFNDLVTSQKIDEGEWSGTGKLAFRFTDDAMAYASYAKGYKASGYNHDRERLGTAFVAPVADADTSFPAEKVDSYELGLKTTWAQDSLALNLALFYQDYENFQLNTFTGIAFEVVGIPEVTSEGVDFDFVWYTPIDSLSLQGGVTYADTNYGDDLGTLPPVLFRLPGSQMSFAPEWSGSLSATFEQPLGATLMWRANVGAKYMSEYNTGSDLAPTKEQDSFTLVDARIGIGSQSESWMLEIWSQNLTDEEYIQVGFDATLQPGTTDAFLGAQQTYGATLRVKF